MDPSTQSRRLSGSATVVEDHDQGIVHLKLVGFIDIPLLEKQIGEMQEVVLRLRSLDRPVRVLADMVEALPQSQEVSARARELVDDVYGPDDKIAIVVASSLIKMQMRRVHSETNTELFISKSAATMWLGSFDRPSSRVSGA